MPGSIQVSVLGLMDLPSSTLLSSLSLKAVMGKREYHTVGDGELSFPVMSIQENLIVAMHDAEGLEILRTEFRTMLLLERGFLETLFPLKNGGTLHMKLQFSLSEEDRKRIREMRDLALKKKRLMEKPWTRLKRSLSDNRFGGSKSTDAQIITENMAIAHSELTDPGGPYFGQRDKFLARRIGAGESPRSVVAGERDAESFLLKKKCETKKYIPFKDLKIDKEFHEVEIGMEDIKLTENTCLHADSPYSAPSNSSITIDTVDSTIGTGKSTVLAVSARTFDERNDFASVIVEKGSSTRPILLNPKADGVKEDLNLIQKEDGNLDLNTSFKARTSSHSGGELLASCVELWTSGTEHGTSGGTCDSRNRIGDENANFSKGVDFKTETMDDNKNNNKQQNFMGKFTPLNKTADELEMIEHPYQQRSFVEVARTGNVESTSRNPSNKLASSDDLKIAGKKHNSRNWSGDGKTVTLDANEINKEEQTHRDKSLPSKKNLVDSEKDEHLNQEDSSVELGRTMNEEIMSQIPSDEHAVPGNSYEKVGELKYGYNSVCSIGFLGTWTSRHLCITTRSNLLRVFPESFFLSSETNLIENSYMRDTESKVQNCGEEYLQGKHGPSFVNFFTENSTNSLKSIGGLIQQGVQIVVIIVACGLLLKNS